MATGIFQSPSRSDNPHTQLPFRALLTSAATPARSRRRQEGAVSPESTPRGGLPTKEPGRSKVEPRGYSDSVGDFGGATRSGVVPTFVDSRLSKAFTMSSTAW